jgi:hypothetical protein
MGTMDTVVGADGKRYPAVRERYGTFPEPVRAEVIRLTHLFRCSMGLQYREIVSALAEVGYRRALGSVYADIQQFQCPDCLDGVPAGAHVTAAADGAW